MSRLQEKYQNELAGELQKKLGGMTGGVPGLF